MRPIQRPDPLETAFLDEGAVQCGFCIPGMVMAARSLLDRNPHPSRGEIREGLAGNLCRCTGYERIIRAVERAAGTASERVAERTAGAARDARGASDSQAAPHQPTLSFSPRRLHEALAILHEREDSIRIIAGATDLLTGIKLGLEHPGVVLDIGRIDSLRGISRKNGAIEIGAMTTLAEIASDPLIARSLPMLARAAHLFGAVAIQNRATIGGNLMSASPAADSPPALAALDATAVLASAEGEREVPIRSFFPAYRRTERRPGEILTRVRSPRPVRRDAPGVLQGRNPPGAVDRQGFSGMPGAIGSRQESSAMSGWLRGAWDPCSIILEQTEQLLEGRKPSRNLAAEAAEAASREVRPIDDIRSTEIYRRTIAGRLLRRFLEGFLEGARG